MKKPSGSFLAWENTLCNALDHPRIQSQNAWEDGYASGVAAEREKFEKLIDELTNKSLHAQLNAVAAEREACADIAENWRCNGCPRTVLADQIRARGKE
jgi:hypothetical protein